MYMEVVFPEPTKVNYLMFRNYYTHSITVKHQEAGSTEWVTVLNKHKLMKNCHSETDAQEWHTIDVFKTFVRTFDCFRVDKLRIYVSQPSPHWSSFGLQELVAFAVNELPADPPAPAVCPQVLSAASDVLTLVQSVKEHRQEFKRHDKFSKYLDKVPLDIVLSRAAGGEITELR